MATIPSSTTCHGVLGRGEEIENRSGVQAESPKAVQSQVDDKDASHDESNQSEVDLADTTEHG